MVYFALSLVGNYAKEERTMAFEHLARSGAAEELQAVEVQSDVSEVDMSVEQKV